MYTYIYIYIYIWVIGPGFLNQVPTVGVQRDLRLLQFVGTRNLGV